MKKEKKILHDLKRISAALNNLFDVGKKIAKACDELYEDMKDDAR